MLKIQCSMMLFLNRIKLIVTYSCSKKNSVVIFSYLQAALSLSMISPQIVGDPMEVDRLYDGVNYLISLMVGIFQTSGFNSA